MKKLCIILATIAFLGCSSEDEGEEMCCGEPKSEILQHINTVFPELLESENLSDEQRTSLEEKYAAAQENPCEYYRQELEQAGASCN